MEQAERRVTPRDLRQFPGRLRRRFVILPEHKVVYVKNAKAGASTLTLWLHRVYTGDLSGRPIQNIHAHHAMPEAEDLGWRPVARMLDGAAFRFSFVRDPIRRCESSYLDKIVATKHDKFRRHVRDLLELPSDAELGLDEFVDALEAEDPLKMNPHWRPQFLNLMHPLIELDFIGRLENFDADLARLRVLADLPDAPVTVRNVQKRPSGGLLEGRPDLVRRVREVYARDFELYGY